MVRKLLHRQCLLLLAFCTLFLFDSYGQCSQEENNLVAPTQNICVGGTPSSFTVISSGGAFHSGGCQVPLIFDPANSNVTVRFRGTHSYVGDLQQWRLIAYSSPGVAAADVELFFSDHLGSSSDNFGGAGCFLSFTTDPATSTVLNLDGIGNNHCATYATGTRTNPGNVATNTQNSVRNLLNGIDVRNYGFAVQIYDCTGLDVGTLTDAVIEFNVNGTLVTYTLTGSSAINDNSCDASIASKLDIPTPYTVHINWYDAATGGSLLQTNSGSYTPNASLGATVGENYVYYNAECYNNSTNTYDPCASTATRKSGKINVYALPIISNVSANAACDGSLTRVEVTASIDAQNPGGTALQYALSPAGPWQNSNVFTGNPIAGSPTTVYVRSLSGATAVPAVTPASCLVSQEPIPTPILPVIADPVLSGSGAACEGGTITITQTTNYIGAVTYRWYNNGVLIPGAAASSYTISPATVATHNGRSITVEADVDGCTSALSNAYVLSVNTPPAATLTLSANVSGASGLCVSSDAPQVFTVTATPTAGTAPYTYNWAGPNGYSSNGSVATVNATSSAQAGVYSVTITDALGCTAALSSANASVRDIPAPFTISGPGEICRGTQANYTVSVPTNPASQWQITGCASCPISGVASSTISVSDFNTIGSATGNVSYTQVSANGCSRTVQQTVSVNANPNPTLPASSTNCSGGNIVIAAPTLSTGTTPYFYTWSGPNGFTSNLASPTIYNANSSNTGSYAVTVTDNKGCTATAATTVSIGASAAAVAIQSNSPLCAGDNLILTCNSYSEPGVTYSWTGPAGAITNNSPVLIIPNATAADAGSYSVTVSFPALSGCTGASATHTVVVNANPTLSVVSPANINCSNGTLPLNLSSTIAGGLAPYAIVWAGPNGFSSADEDPVIANATAANSGAYTVSVTDANGCKAAPRTVTASVSMIPAQPVVIGNPTVCEGNSISLSTSSYTGNSVVFEWQNGGVTVPAIANNEIFINPATNANDNGDVYRVRVTVDGCTSAFSNTVTLTVNQAPTSAPTSNSPITCSDGTQTLNLTSNPSGGTPPYTYSWMGPKSFSSSAANPAVSNVTLANAGYYNLVVTDANGCVSGTSSVGVVVTSRPNQLVISGTGPVCEGTPISLVAPVVSGATVIYRWYNNGVLVAGVSGNTLSIPSPTNAADNGDVYTVDVNVAGCVSTISAGYSLTVYPKPNANLSSNAPILCTDGTQSLNLSATTTAGVAPFTFLWNGPNGLLTSIQNPTVPNAGVNNSGTYTLVVKDVNGCESNLIALNAQITRKPITPTITSDDNSMCVGSTFTLTSSVAYSGNAVAYEWITPTGVVSTAIPSLTVSNAATTASGNYSMRAIIDGCTSNTSNAVAILVTPKPATPVITANALALCEGQTLILNANTPAASFSAWQGPNNFQTKGVNNVTVASVTASNAGTYTLFADSLGCISNTTSVTITVNPTPTKPDIQSNAPICAGVNLQLWTNATAANYIWQNPDLTSATTTTATYTRSAATAAFSGIYRLTVESTNGCRSVSSDPLSVTVNPIPTAPLATNSGPICAGVSATLDAGTAAAGTTYTWYLSSTNAAISSNQVHGTGVLNTSTSYYVVATANGCSSPSSSTTVVVNPIPVTPVLSAPEVCQFETLNVSTSTTGAYIYNWSGPNGYVASTQNVVIANASPSLHSGTYTLTLDSNGCTSSASISAVVKTKPNTPTISSNAPICAGGNLVLTTTGNTGQTVKYYWMYNGAVIDSSTVANYTISNATAANSGNYQVYVNNSACISLTSAVEAVVVNAIPAVPNVSSNSPVCEGSAIQLNSTTVADSYSWTGPNGYTSLSQNPQVVANATANDAGTYQLQVTVNGCTSPAGATTVVVNPTPAKPDIQSNAPICEGADLQLWTNATAANYIWQNPDLTTATTTTATYTRSAATAAFSGNYRLTVESTNGCRSVSSDPLSVTVNPIPTAPLATNSGPICAGASATLDAGTAAGTTYTWYLSSTNAAISTNQVHGTGVLNTSTSYYVVATANGCSSPSSSTTVVVNPIPVTPVLSAPEVCQFETLNVSTSTTGAYIYNWSGPNGYVASTQNVVIANASPSLHSGTYTLTLDSNGCTSSASISAVVKTKPNTPTISSNAPICAGGNLVLTTTGNTGQTVKYYWMYNGAVIDSSTVANYTISNATAANSGNYQVYVNNSACVSLTSAVEAVVVNAIPAVPNVSSNSPVCEGSAIQLNSTTVADSYSWTGPNGYTSSSQNPQVVANATANDAGTYQLQVTINGCTSAAGTTTVVVNPTPATPTVFTVSPVCVGSSIRVWTNQVATSYTWTKPDLSQVTTTADSLIIPSASLSDAGNYTLVVANNGCPSAPSNTVQVVVNSVPLDVAFSGPDAELCPGAVLTTISTLPSAGGGVWTSLDGAVLISPTSSTTQVTNLQEGGVYRLVWTLNNGACVRYSTDTMVIYVAKKPALADDSASVEETKTLDNWNIFANDTVYRNRPTVLTIANQPTHGTLTVNSDKTVDYTPESGFIGYDSFRYEICLADCPDQCDMAWAVVSVYPGFDLPRDIEAPNIITPNGDGKNDKFVIDDLSYYPNNVLSIYNRWGDLIYSAENYQNDWGGTYKGTLDVPDGTYYWVLVQKNNGKTIKGGFITVIR